MSNAFTVAKEICKQLFDAGYIAYFAGGWVRDLLLNRETDEIDIATSAPPEFIESFFSKTIPVGIAYGVVIVVIDGINFEVATFRKDHDYHDGRHPDGVDFSTPEKDATRRDFTINGMFYDPLTELIYDFVGGQKDLKNSLIRAIGIPHQRFAEDKLRMLRAVRFSARFDFKIDGETEKAIKDYAHTLLPSVSMERIWQEFNKMRPFDCCILNLHRLQLLQTIFPSAKFKDLEKHVAPFKYFPLHCPTIIYLLELFPNFSLEEKIGLCRYLKATSRDMKLVEFFHHSQSLFQQTEISDYEWAHFYAKDFHPLFLNVSAAKILPPAKQKFLADHGKRKKQLEKSIERIRHKKPLVSASLLQSEGIKPGKKMGELLQEAEKISINYNLHTPSQALALLKKSAVWPK